MAHTLSLKPCFGDENFQTWLSMEKNRNAILLQNYIPTLEPLVGNLYTNNCSKKYVNDVKINALISLLLAAFYQWCAWWRISPTRFFINIDSTKIYQCELLSPKAFLITCNSKIELSRFLCNEPGRRVIERSKVWKTHEDHLVFEHSKSMLRRGHTNKKLPSRSLFIVLLHSVTVLKFT